MEEFIGKTFNSVMKVGLGAILFVSNTGERWKMYHCQDCCENVYIDDIVGDLDDLIDSPILMAECVTNSDNPKEEYDESFTWTFYKFSTSKGYVTIRWYGASNGYYSEDVDLIKVYI